MSEASSPTCVSKVYCGGTRVRKRNNGGETQNSSSRQRQQQQPTTPSSPERRHHHHHHHHLTSMLSNREYSKLKKTVVQKTSTLSKEERERQVNDIIYGSFGRQEQDQDQHRPLYNSSASVPTMMMRKDSPFSPKRREQFRSYMSLPLVREQQAQPSARLIQPPTFREFPSAKAAQRRRQPQQQQLSSQGSMTTQRRDHAQQREQPSPSAGSVRLTRQGLAQHEVQRHSKRNSNSNSLEQEAVGSAYSAWKRGYDKHKSKSNSRHFIKHKDRSFGTTKSSSNNSSASAVACRVKNKLFSNTSAAAKQTLQQQRPKQVEMAEQLRHFEEMHLREREMIQTKRERELRRQRQREGLVLDSRGNLAYQSNHCIQSRRRQQEQLARQPRHQDIRPTQHQGSRNLSRKHQYLPQNLQEGQQEDISFSHASTTLPRSFRAGPPSLKQPFDCRSIHTAATAESSLLLPMVMDHDEYENTNCCNDGTVEVVALQTL